ncbi:MAG TPA: DMT family transporter [Vitreimonas sp.]|nr:DMT family transporter [Vitreimonas sp.]
MTLAPKYQGALALVLSAALGGALTPALIRVGVEAIHPLVFNLGRGVSTLLIFMVILGPQFKTLFTPQLRVIVLLFGATIGGNILLFSLGIPYTTLVASQLLYALLPITVPMLSYVVSGETVSRRKVTGGVIAMAGLALLIVLSRRGGSELSLGTLYGNSLIFLAVFCYTAYLVYSKKVVAGFSPLILGAASYLGVTLFYLPLAIGYIALQQPQIIISSALMWAVGGLALVSFLQTTLIQIGLKRVSSMTAAVISLLGPEFAAVVGWVFFREQLTAALLISMSLVMLGVLISVTSEQESWWARAKRRVQSWSIVANR